MAKSSTPKKKPTRDPFRLDIFIIELAGKFGITGAIILSILYVFLNKGTDEQHQEFIDKFILLKYQSGDNPYVFYVGIFIAVLFIGQQFYFRNRINTKNERIKQLEEHISSLESKILKK